MYVHSISSCQFAMTINIDIASINNSILFPSHLINQAKISVAVLHLFDDKHFSNFINQLFLRQIALMSSEQQFVHHTHPKNQTVIIFDLNVNHNPDRTLIK